MRAHYFQHVPFEGLGCIRPWLLAAGYEVTCTRFFESAEIPALDEVDFLIAMGGPMSVNDEEELPWLVAEKRFIRRAIEAGKAGPGDLPWRTAHRQRPGYPGLSQRTEGNRLVSPAWNRRSAGLLPIPRDHPGVSLARRDLRSAFRSGPLGAKRRLRESGVPRSEEPPSGTQFHLETTPEAAEKLVVNCRAELVPSRYVQSERELLEAPAGNYGAVNGLMVELLSFLTRPGR